MADEKEQVKRVQAEAAPTTDEVLDQDLYDALMNATPEDLIAPDPTAEAPKGNTLPSTGWLHSPARLELLATADDRLARVAELIDPHFGRVERVHVRLLKGSKRIILTPARANDLSALPVKRYETNAGAWVNLFTLLGPKKMTEETGYKARYDVALIPEGSPLGKGLVIDLGKRKERRKESKKDQSDPAAEQGK